MNPIQNPNEDKPFVRGACLSGVCLIGASLAGCAACWWAAGTSLGLFFGGLFVTTFLIPAAILGQKNLYAVLIGFAATVAPIAATWLIATLKTSDTIEQWVEATAVLLTYALAISGIATLLTNCKLPEIFSAAAAITIGLAWLTWPIWLSATLEKHATNAAVEAMVKIHPPLVINGILTGEPAWTEMSLAYHLTNLNQDIPIRLPATATACAATHGMIGFFLWAAAYGIARNPRRLYLIEDPIFPEKQ
ncbi:MAG TPA: hypothetical protein VGG44_08940 [Tepidisphaeraceae bacterium]|jgi:hypothetical protein